MGAPKAETQQNAITSEQLAIEQQQVDASNQDRAQRLALMDPAIQFNKALTSGDRATAMAALAPALAPIDAATKANKEAIWESAPGAARDVALQQNDAAGRTAVASTESNSFLSAFDKLANIGSGIGSFSLSEIGAGISAGSAASQSNQAVMNAQAQQKASTMGFLGSLAGAAAQPFHFG